ncbi:MAG TPA: hypothetical protein VGF25_07765 [Thermoleophilaceae bacterium]
MRVTLGCAAALAAVMATAGPAAAAPRMYDYELEIRGAQTNKWSKAHANQGGCDVAFDGSGRETVKFSSKPLRVKLLRGAGGGGGPFMILPPDPAKRSYLPLRATVKRSGSITSTPGEICSWGDGTGQTTPPDPPDCGTKRARGIAVDLRFLTTPKNMLYMTQGETPADPFKNCPNGSDAFPHLLHYNTQFRPIGHRFDRRDLGLLFAQGKFELIARGTRTIDTDESSETTSIWWAASFKRIGRKR